jgi:alpha-N-arabinofuranosidase
MWMPYHNLGREVFLTPARLTEDGWIEAGVDGTTDESYEIAGDFEQKPLKVYTFESTDFNIDWCFMRTPDMADYTLTKDKVTLKGTGITLDDVDSPTFIALRQREHKFDLRCDAAVDKGEGGITIYMDENEHYEIVARKTDEGYEAILRLNIGGIKHIQSSVPLSGSKARLIIEGDNLFYTFKVQEGENDPVTLGGGSTKYITSEVSGGFTGAMIGLYAVNGIAEFEGFELKYKE